MHWATILALAALAAANLTCAQPVPPLRSERPPNTQLGPLAPTGTAVKSPELQPNGRFTFRLAAPNAQTVELHANFPSGYEPSVLPMMKGEDGVWSITVGPLAPEFRFYSFYVDGVPALDPSNPHTRRDG